MFHTSSVQEILTFVGVMLSIVAPIPYIRQIIHGEVKPHIITWLIWTIVMGAAFVVQIIGGGGIGSLVLGFTAVMNLVVLVFALRISKSFVTKFDLIILALALTAFVPWILTKNPTISIVLFTATIFLGYVPTFKKSWVTPQHETVSLYVISGVKQLINMAALSSYNILTCIVPGSYSVRKRWDDTYYFASTNKGGKQREGLAGAFLK